MNLGLIGKSLTHSFSPAYFTNKFVSESLTNHQYKAYEIEQLDEVKLHELILNEKLDGFNITIPYKERILPFLNELSDDASAIGAVNTVVVNWANTTNYTLKGYNTDWTGFLKSIRPFLTTHHQKALILGTGGASKAIGYALRTLGIDCFYASRSRDIKKTNQLFYDDLNNIAIQQFKLIINTTPLGTVPAIESYPNIPYQFIGKDHLLCDLVYNPSETQFMKQGKANGAAVLNGLGMLQFQADEAWQIWNNKKGHSV
jgi:shikimate dehydrogenase